MGDNLHYMQNAPSLIADSIQVLYKCFFSRLLKQYCCRNKPKVLFWLKQDISLEKKGRRIKSSCMTMKIVGKNTIITTSTIQRSMVYGLRSTLKPLFLHSLQIISKKFRSMPARVVKRCQWN